MEKKDKKFQSKQHYSKRLLDDLACRDFTINAIAMSHSGKLTDAYNGYEDIRKKRIQPIGNNIPSYEANPIRMLRAIRLMSIHHYKMSSRIRGGIRKYRKHLQEADRILLVQELKKLFSGKYYKQTLDELVSFRLHKYIPSLQKAFKYQNNHFKPFDFDSFLLVAFLLNNEVDETYYPYVGDLIRFKKIMQLAQANPKCIYSSLDYFSNGLEVCLEANRLNAYLRKAKKRHKKIVKEYEALPIHQVCDLSFKGEDILSLIPDQNVKIAQAIIDKMIVAILSGEIINDYDVLKVYVINELKNQDIALGDSKVAYDYHPPVEEGTDSLNPSYKKETAALDD